jgi:succinoglycan biosynthesis protein ExoA
MAADHDRDLPFITVIVPVRNEEKHVRETLDSLVSQDYDVERFEILVVDGESMDATRDIVREVAADHPQVALCDNPKRLSSAARNIGVTRARGEYLLIIDGHCQLTNRSYLRDLADAFSRSGADCIGRPQPLDVDGATTAQKAIAAARSSWLGHHPGSHIYATAERFVRPQSVAVAYRRTVFNSVGLFDEAFDACEDVEFNHRVDRAGLRCFFTPKVVVRYHPRSSFGGLFRQLARYGRGRVRLLRKHPETFSLPSLIPAVFVLGLISGPALSWLFPVLAYVYVGALALYAAIVGTVSVATAAGPEDLGLLPYLPPVFAIIHIASGWGILVEAVRGAFGKWVPQARSWASTLHDLWPGLRANDGSSGRWPVPGCAANTRPPTDPK